MKIKNISSFCALIISFLFVPILIAQNSVKCPVCGIESELDITLNGKGTDTRLDMKPLGFEHPPWQIPVCKECGFAIYADVIPEKDLAIIKSFIKTQDYTKFHDRESNYLMALIFEKLKREKLEIAFAYLKASWQTEGKKELYKENLKNGIKYLDEYLKQVGESSPAALQYAVLRGELFRLCGNFDEAAKQFHQVYILLSAQDSKNGFDRVLDFEFDLLQKKDSLPHAFSEIP